MASNAGSGSLGSLTVNLNADTAQYSAAMSKAELEAEQWSKKTIEAAQRVGAAIGGAISVGAFVASIKTAIDVADELSDAAAKANVSVEALGGVQFAVKQAGGSAASATDAIAKLNRTLADAAAGEKNATRAFEAIGVSVTDAAGKTRAADAVLADVADKFATYADGPEKAALAVALFKRGGEALLPVLNAGGDALRENIEYWKRFSGISTESAEAAGHFNDTLDKLKLISSGTAQAVANGLTPALQAIADELLRFKENGNSAVTVAGVIKTIFEAVAIATANVAFVFGGLGREIGGIAARIAALASGNFNVIGESFTAISDAVKADGIRARAELDALELRIRGFAGGQGKSGEELPGGGGGAKGAAPRLMRDDKVAKVKDRTAEIEREAKRIQDAEEEAARVVGEAWGFVAKERNKELEAYATAEALMWKQVYAEIDAAQEREIAEGKAYMDAVAKDGEEAFKRLEHAVRGWGMQFSSIIADAVLGAKVSFGDLVNSIVRDLIRIQVQKNIADPLVKAGTDFLDGVFGRGAVQLSGPTEGGGGLLDSLGSGIKNLFGFAGGGSFKVGGSGGTDSQVVAFRASPDETVSITRPGDVAGGVSVNVINNGPPVTAQAQAPRMDGGRLMVDVILNAARTDGNFRAGLAAALSPARG